VIGVYELFERIKEIGNDLIEFAQKSFYASKRQDLEDAGKALADFFVLGGITLVETLVLSRAFKFARTAIAKKFPLPKTLRERFSRRKIERAERRRRREQLKDKLLEANLQNPALVLEGSKRLTKEIDEAGFPLVLGLGMLAVSVTSGLLLMKALDDGKSK
jgi:Rad3-related DNA helicase